MPAPIWKRVEIPLGIKIKQEQVHVFQSETNKPANTEAEFKQSTQCYSQWGLTSKSRLWNVERSMIKTAESTAQSTQATYYFSTYIASSFDCAQDLQTFASPMLTEWQTEKPVKFKDKLNTFPTPHTQLETSKKRNGSDMQKNAMYFVFYEYKHCFGCKQWFLV